MSCNSTKSKTYYKTNVWNLIVQTQNSIIRSTFGMQKYVIRNLSQLRMQYQSLTCNNTKSELLILFLDHRLIAMVQTKKLITIWTLKLITRSSLECNSTKSETYYNLECNTTKSGTNL